MTTCMECGMVCVPAEYHPYAACLMFKGCHDGDAVRVNLTAIAAPPAARSEMSDAQQKDLLAAALYLSGKDDDSAVLNASDADRIADLLLMLAGFDIDAALSSLPAKVTPPAVQAGFAADQAPKP